MEYISESGEKLLQIILKSKKIDDSVVAEWNRFHSQESFDLSKVAKLKLLDDLHHSLYTIQSSKSALRALLLLYKVHGKAFFGHRILGSINPFEQKTNSFETLGRSLDRFLQVVGDELSKEEKNILWNVMHYCAFLHRIKPDWNRYQTLLRKRKKNLIATLLMNAETSFNERYFLTVGYRTIPKGTEYYVTKEQIATAITFCLHQHLTDNKFPEIGRTSDYKNNDSKQIIHLSWLFSEVRELWPRIMTANFLFAQDKEGTFVFSSRIPNYTKSIVNCNIKEIFAGYKYRDVKDSEFGSLEGLVEKIYKRYGDFLCPTTTHGTGQRRVVLKLIDPSEESSKPLYEAIRKLLMLDETSPNVFKEEYFELLLSSDDLVYPLEELAGFEVTKGMTFTGLMRIHRIMKIFSMIKMKKVEEVMEGDLTLYENSLVSGIPLEKVFSIMEALNVNRKDLELYLSVVAWKLPKELPKDIQYKPLIIRDNFLIILDNVMAKSRVIRNILAEKMLRPDSQGKNSYPEKYLGESLENLVDFYKHTIKFDFKSVAGDIDSLIVVGKTLYICEVKNTILPCTSYEERGVMSLLDTAVEQLDDIAQLVQDPAFLGELGEKVGYKLTSLKVEFAIILTTRWMSGCNYKGYPIRHILEIGKILEDKCVKVHSLVGERLIRPENCESSEDILQAYFSEEGFHYKQLFASTNVEYLPLKFKEVMLLKELAHFNFLDFARNVGFSGEELSEIEKHFRKEESEPVN